jgi:hypothetical protein
MNSDKAEGRAIAARKKATLVAVKKLDAAADAVSAFALACALCADASSPRGDDDSRRLLAQNMREFAGHLNSVYDK